MVVKKTPPVVIGEEIELQIERLNHDGEGVGRHKGFTVFVPDTVPDDHVIARVISVQKNYARALIGSLVSPSKKRTIPACEHFDACGGCQLQHIDYHEQLQLKQALVEDAIRRIAHLDATVLPTIGMNDPWQYRNKAQVPVGLEEGIVRAGFYEKRSHQIVDVSCCHIQHPANDQAVHTVRHILGELKIPIYNEATHTGLIRHIMARTSFSTGDVLVVLITNGRLLPAADTLATHIRQSIPNITGIVQNINTRPGNVILGKEEITLWGTPYLTERIGSLHYRVSSRSFFQVNPEQTEKLYTIAKKYAGLTGNETVFDLYSGIGTIGLHLADKAAKVVGVEIVAAAVDDSRYNAELNNIDNSEFYLGAAEEVVPKLLKQGYRADVIIVDPPRKGCDQALLQTMTTMKPGRIVYISCNPSTLARDLQYLTNNGYQVGEIQPVDMFPHTNHVECVVLMSRVEG